ncbi:MAG: transketolase [Candidatus Harrisonbacteria bacterium RIFCSPLOWO2_02_FULL_41_11]|uniref:Transketolase n=1 Tax=Candidatus Harrisonbacteria bacterium RIFCSPHIGHO2_02_FULL_42_16 TaxID=1798404 RepID=A0A1G1ZFJ4_9BACT|nr:MAG: transketolase [Candidatus Harrisonbacteria bacterium RIFCSPHIGHO2_02_FULL_42_16]OGY65594.1 MAG: transketolase [Candidatus Harrisonbacteria bacterium RIFCSPLOWO2_02_FULL_41_11]
MELHEKKLQFLEEMANKIRRDLIGALIEAKSGHSAGPLGMADIFAAMYFHVLNHRPSQPNWPDRDRLILSNGHICPVQYAAMANAGYFPVEEFKSTLRKLDSRFQGHPHRGSLPGLETTSGPLGSGISQAIGMALAARLNGGKYRVYCLTSDGEHQEGNTWEAIMFAGKQKSKLNNLTVIMDRNNIQIDGFTEEVMPLESLREKYESFNWHVIEVNGHDIQEFVSAVNEAKAIYEKPTVIIAHTVPGKGVSFMENNYLWHGNPPGKGPENLVPKERQGAEALKELRTLQGQIKSEHE